MRITDVINANKAIGRDIGKTPLKLSRFFSSMCGGTVYLKLENMQVTSSFKIRGASNRMLHLTENEKRKGVITASAGNHAQAVAIVAKKLNLKAKIIVPKTTPMKKINKISRYGVDLILYGASYDEAEQKAIRMAIDEGITYISPYNDELVIAGQGTIGLEILDDLKKVDVVLVPVGGGGLISGIGFAVKHKSPNTKILGVQSEASPVMHDSLKAGKIIETEVAGSIADGLSGGIEKGSITFEMVQKYADEVLLVKEKTIREAIKLLWEHEKQIAEGAGAVGLAAILENKERFKNKICVVIISGGNIDDSLFHEIISNGVHSQPEKPAFKQGRSRVCRTLGE
ncbi:MAG: threonine/serine dehydratase, partial [Candidatus Micrarchaeota archaeon]|nr:threonine/serine dehydratase [Candidatus Micrarchaeota archaeon]